MTRILTPVEVDAIEARHVEVDHAPGYDQCENCNTVAKAKREECRWCRLLDTVRAQQAELAALCEALQEIADGKWTEKMCPSDWHETGHAYFSTCPACNGKGRQRLSVRIPPRSVHEVARAALAQQADVPTRHVSA